MSISHLSDVITCLALDNCGSYIVTGSKDCTCIIWSLLANVNVGSSASSAAGVSVGTASNAHLLTASPTPAKHGHVNTNNSLTPKPLHTLYGHDDTVSCVAIMTELDIVVSGSLVWPIVNNVASYFSVTYSVFSMPFAGRNGERLHHKRRSICYNVKAIGLYRVTNSNQLYCVIISGWVQIRFFSVR